ncbi:MAG: hypothetical protein AAF567_19255 [Actinomycetota bacterium]
MTRVLVTGTDRPVGAAILPRLVRHGLLPVAAVGDPASSITAVDHDVVAGGQIAVDLDVHADISAALDDVATLVHAADVRPGGSEDIPQATRAMASACADRGVHLLFLSRVGADASSLSHRKALWQAEQIVEQTPNLGYTIQRITHTHPGTECLMHGPWLPLPSGTPIQPVAPDDVAGRVVGLVQAGPSERVRDYGGPELMRFADVVHVYKQIRGSAPRRVPIPAVGVMAEAVDGIHVSGSGDRGSITFRTWLGAA